MPKLILSPTGKTFSCQIGDSLLDALLKNHLFIDAPCCGKGLCGKCRIRVLSGGVTPVTETEKTFLHLSALKEGIRLACLTVITGDVTVELLKRASGLRILSGGFVPAFTRDTFSKGKGVCIDIGTTTVVTGLIDLKSGLELSHVSALNAQTPFGLDVLTRITYVYEHPETGTKRLQIALVTQLNELILKACQSASVSPDEITKITVSANCTLMHTLLGVDIRPIGRAPYKPVFLGAQCFPAKEIGLTGNPCAELYCLPHVSAFIGADIVSGVVVAGLNTSRKNILFIDIGTNGEMVLATEHHLLSCSCAAGPALEGMNISSGMRAAEGAVEDVRIEDRGITFKTIGDGPPQGFCGSGILSATKELLRIGILKPSGVFIKPESLPDGDWRRPYLHINGGKREFVFSSDPLLIITQKDIRQIQLAKGALLSGFKALLRKAHLSVADLDEVIVAGQFGAHLSDTSLVGTGILPADVMGKITYIGNASRTGAYMALLSQRAKDEMTSLASRIEYMELASSDDYERIFMTSLNFPSFDQKETPSAKAF